MLGGRGEIAQNLIFVVKLIFLAQRFYFLYDVDKLIVVALNPHPRVSASVTLRQFNN